MTDAPACVTEHRHTRLLYREVRDTIAAELPAGAGEIRSVRGLTATGNTLTATQYAAYVARLRVAADLAEGCGHCASKHWRVVRFRALLRDDSLWWSFVACTTCGHCEQV